ncbi:MAG: hypothetical protein ABJB74_02760 [Gemmatimonas sp.]
MKRLRFAVLTALLISATPLWAQTPASTVVRDAADSATVARTEYRNARETLARGDTTAALDKLVIAAQAWPVQPAYASALLELSVRVHDFKRAAIALAMANRIGVALTVSAPATALLDSAREMESLRALRAEQNVLGAPLIRSRTFRTLNDSTLFPEGLAIDPRNGMVYVSSVRHRNVIAVATDGRESFLLWGERANVGGIFGIVVDTTRGVLWAASAPNAAMIAKGDTGAAVAALLAIRLSDGQLIRRIAIPLSAANSSPGDIALAANGDVLLSDSQAPVLWWLRGTSDTLIGIRHHLFRSLQGIVPSADGKVAWVADYSHGLLRVELNTCTVPAGDEHNTCVVQRVADLPGHTTVGLDGMVRFGDSFIAVQNGFVPTQVLQIVLNATGTRVVQQSVIDRNPIATSPTGGVVVRDQFIYIANSLWELLDDAGKFPLHALLPRPMLLQLPLRK